MKRRVAELEAEIDRLAPEPAGDVDTPEVRLRAALRIPPQPAALLAALWGIPPGRWGESGWLREVSRHPPLSTNQLRITVWQARKAGADIQTMSGVGYRLTDAGRAFLARFLLTSA